MMASVGLLLNFWKDS